MAWDETTLASRISDKAGRVRYEAGSPNEDEVAVYRAFTPASPNVGVVLGMTPELRRLAASLCQRVYAIDSSPSAIDLYSGWLAPELRSKETIINADWLSLRQVLPTKVDVVFADGVFGNILSVAGHATLLREIESALTSGGRLITRHALAPVVRSRADQLISRYRAGELADSEFGFDLRIMGYWDIAYDDSAKTLDCSMVFDRMQEDYEAGILSEKELSLAQRFLFRGKNLLLGQSEWEGLLTDSGFRFQVHNMKGRSWYDYYPVYCCVSKR